MMWLLRASLVNVLSSLSLRAEFSEPEPSPPVVPLNFAVSCGVKEENVEPGSKPLSIFIDSYRFYGI